MLDIYILYEYNIHMMNIRRRILFLTVSAVSLFLGLLIYVLFRSGTYIHLFLNSIDSFDEFLTLKYNNYFTCFLKYYFADFLWGISLSCFLSAVSDKSNLKRIVANSTIPVVLGVLLEIFQNAGLINGTADFCDVLMYVAAGLFHAVINIILFKRR